MAEYKDREHFIPLRKSDLVELLCKDKSLSVQEREPFKQFCLLASSVFHFEYLKQLEELKDSYAPFDPDADTRTLHPPTPEQRQKNQDALFDKFVSLMERANFKHLTRDEMHAAMSALSSDLGLMTDVDLGVFERLEVFTRGEVMGTRTKRSWLRLGRKQEIKVPLYQRLVLAGKLRPHRRLDRDISTDPIYLKIFKNIPKVDLDMMLPGARVRMTRLDKALIAYPLIGGVGVLLYNILNQILHDPTEAKKWAAASGLGAAAIWTVAAALGGYGYKSYYSYQVKKQAYNFRLTKSLYYLSLDNNMGVLMRVLDEAEEQECRETFLAYFCLLKFAPPQGWTSEQLDDYVELYLERYADLKVDFEIGDALAKLERLKIVEKVGEAYRARPLEKALEVLDYTWDNYFKYNNPDYEPPPV
jgi:hypothetical protein